MSTDEWKLRYDREVIQDIRSFDRSMKERIAKAFDQKLRVAPDKLGKPLSGDLAGFRSLRVGAARIVYSVDEEAGEARILVVGPRRNHEVYKEAGNRLD